MGYLLGPSVRTLDGTALVVPAPAASDVGEVLTVTAAGTAAWAGGTLFELRGTGSPEGVVTAAVGTYYTDTAGTNGAWRWLKKAGAGNTGWWCIAGDTGWRDIPTTATTYTGSLKLRRAGDLVHITDSTLTAGGSPINGETLYTLPTGFRALGTLRGLYGQNGAAATKLLGVSTTVNAYSGPVASQTVQFSFLFLTSDAWPTTLPGT